jgi:hypothetical protein
MSNEYDASEIGRLELEPSNLDVLLQKSPIEWTEEDWLYAVFRADEPDDARWRILDSLHQAIPLDGGGYVSVLEFWETARTR